MEHTWGIKLKPPSNNQTLIIVVALICLTCYLVCNKGKNIYYDKDGFRVASVPDSVSLAQSKIQLDTAKRNLENSMNRYDSLINNEPDSVKRTKLQGKRKVSEELYHECNSMIAEYNDISVMANSEVKNERFKSWIDKSKNIFGKYSNQSVSTVDVFYALVGYTRKIADSLRVQVENLQKDTARLIRNNENLAQQLTNQKKETAAEKLAKEEERKAKEKADSLQMATDLKAKEEIISENAVIIKNFRANPQGKRQRMKNNILYVNSNHSELKLEILFQVKILPGVSVDTIYAEIDKALKLSDANIPKTICDKTFNYQNNIPLDKT